MTLVIVYMIIIIRMNVVDNLNSVEVINRKFRSGKPQGVGILGGGGQEGY